MENIIVEYLLADSVNELLQHPDFIGLVAIVMGCATGMVAIVFGLITGVLKTKAREETKRELAAYVAEGTIDPDKAIAMLQAGETICEITGDGIKVS